MGDAMEKYTFNELCTLVELPIRTVRFYIQKGLVSPPEGSRKGAYYTRKHLDELLAIRKWQKAGLSLERIRELLFEGTVEPGELPPPRGRRPGDVEVWSKLFVKQGLEIHLEPKMAGMSPEQVREFCRRVMELAEEMTGDNHEN
jgi:DNA-binding transcriptional MerR regulator